MQRRILFLGLIGFCHTVFAVELQPYASAKVTASQWSAYHDKVKEELASSRGSFRYEAGDLETYSEPKSYTNIAFTAPGHKAHPAWVATRIVVEGKKIGIHVFGYYAGDEAAYREFYQRMDDMAAQTLKSLERQ